MKMALPELTMEDLETAADLARFGPSAVLFYPVLHDLAGVAAIYGVSLSDLEGA